MNRMVLVRTALLVTAVSVGMAACGDDASSPGPTASGGDGGTPGSGGANHAGGSSSDAGDGSTIKGGQPSGDAGSSAGGAGGAGGVAALAGASSGGEGGARVADGGAAGSGGEVGGPPACDLKDSYGTLTDLQGTVADAGQGGIYYEATLPELPANPLFPDLLHVELFPNLGAFPNNLTTLTNHVIAGDDLNYGTCGLCVILHSNVDVDSGAAQRYYFVTAGTVTLSSVTGRMTGTLKNASFVEVTIEDGTFVSTPVPGGCTTTITSMPFDAVIP